jgi:hypothetical protein
VRPKKGDALMAVPAKLDRSKRAGNEGILSEVRRFADHWVEDSQAGDEEGTLTPRAGLASLLEGATPASKERPPQRARA